MIPIKRKNTWLKRILLAGSILLIAGGIIIWYFFTLKFDDTKTLKADVTVNAFDFLNEFKTDPNAPNLKYKDKILIVNGRVSEKEVAIDSSVNIKMIDTLTDNFIIFAFQDQNIDEAKNVAVGDSIAIKGSFSDGIYSDIYEAVTVNFKRCTLNK